MGMASVVLNQAGVSVRKFPPSAATSFRWKTSEIFCEYALHIFNAGFVTISGDRWTTYRKMALDIIGHATTITHLPERLSGTRDLSLIGWHNKAENFDDLPPIGPTLSSSERW